MPAASVPPIDPAVRSPLRVVLFGACVTKKNHGDIVFIGSRCPRCHRGNVPLIQPSAQYKAWRKLVAPQLRAWWQRTMPGEVACTRCKGTGRRSDSRCVGCAGTGARPPSLVEQVHVVAVFYRERNQGDLVNFMGALSDVLEEIGILANDRQIISWNDTRLDKDNIQPRTELEIKVLHGPQTTLIDI